MDYVHEILRQIKIPAEKQVRRVRRVGILGVPKNILRRYSL